MITRILTKYDDSYSQLILSLHHIFPLVISWLHQGIHKEKDSKRKNKEKNVIVRVVKIKNKNIFLHCHYL